MKIENGWKLGATTGPRGLAGSNGMQIGPDGRLYVVSAFGGELAAIDVDSGAREVVSPPGGALSSPDDLAFGTGGAIYVSECMDARVTELRDGASRTVADGLPGANGIATFGDRVFVNECRPAGRMVEIFPDGGEPLLLADGLELPNGMSASPDGFLYFVLVFAGKVGRMSVDGGPVETVAEGLAAPSSTRWADGALWVSQGGNGEVVRIDPADGRPEVVARSRPGIDNLAISPDGRLFISYYIDGEVLELRGEEARTLVPRGLVGPYGVAPSPGGGAFVADGMELARIDATAAVEVLGKYTDPGFPGYLCGIASDDGRLLVTTSAGALCEFDPAASTSTVLAAALALPADVAVAADGTAWVSEEGAGALRGVGLGGDPVDGIDGLALPQGVATDGETIYVAEVGARRLISWRPGTAPVTIATDLPVGADGASKPILGGLPELIPGPVAPLAGLAAAGAKLVLAADGEGSVTILEAG